MRKLLLASAAIALLLGCTTQPERAVVVEADPIAMILETARQINELDQTLEHGAIIINGVPQTIVTGEDSSMAGELFFNTIDLNLIPQITGVIHSHPVMTIEQAPLKSDRDILDEINKDPSPGDMSFAQLLCSMKQVTNGNRAVQPTIDLYVVGPDDILRVRQVAC